MLLREYSSKLEEALRVGKPGLVDAYQPVLILTVGLPRSGKSTWALNQGVPIVNPDAVRLAMHGKPFIAEAEPWVWTMTKTMVKALFIANHFVVILDATNMSKVRRADWISDKWRTCVKVINTPRQECLERAEKTGRQDLVPVIERMCSYSDYPDEFPKLEDLYEIPV